MNPLGIKEWQPRFYFFNRRDGPLRQRVVFRGVINQHRLGLVRLRGGKPEAGLIHPQQALGELPHRLPGKGHFLIGGGWGLRGGSACIQASEQEKQGRFFHNKEVWKWLVRSPDKGMKVGPGYQVGTTVFRVVACSSLGGAWFTLSTARQWVHKVHLSGPYLIMGL